MRPSEEMPLDPDTLAELEAIDATLAGEAVDPIHAELAELALLLVATREQPPEGFAQSLDERVGRRFRDAPSAAAPDARRLRRWPSRPVLGVALAGAFAVIAAAVVIASGSLSGPTTTPVSGSSHFAPFEPLGTSTTESQSNPAVFGAATSSGQSAAKPPSALAGVQATSTGNAGINLTAVPSPSASSGGKQIQSAQLALSAPNSRIDDVAQEVFSVVSIEGGTVQNSQVTASAHGADGGSYATFTLSVPTANLQAAMSRLSSLRYASVASRTDGTQNVSSEYQADQRQISDQEAIRSALLKQLETADTDQAIDSIKAQLKLTESQLASDQKTLRALQHRISYSTLSVQVNGGPIVVLGRTTSHGFTIGRAAHDSVRVLVVAAGVALIACAALVPVGLLAGLVAWFGFSLRRRRRQHALDAA